MLTCQGQHPDGSVCRNPAPAGQTRCYIHRRPDPAAPLNREDVLAAIEEHGGPEGLDLSHEDLSEINLSLDSIEEELRQRALESAPWALHRPWPNERLRVNLEEANLQRAHLQGADLQGAFLQYADLQGAFLVGASLQGADLWRANLQWANLWLADLQGAELNDANLQGADLQNAYLQGADLTLAKLQGAFLRHADLQGAHLFWAKLDRVDLTEAHDITGIRWCDAVLDKTRLRREQLGEKIGDELAAERDEDSYDHAREAYLALKTNFNELGRYEDASWAYRKERRMEKLMHWPGQAATYCKEEIQKKAWAEGEEEQELEYLSGWHPRVWWFYIKHTLRWLADWAVELATDYGESPGRVLAWAALLLLVVYPLIYWWCAGRPAPAGGLLAFGREYLLLSLGAFSTLDVVNLSAASAWTRLWAASEAMLGISLLALLMFTLGNRISRS